MAQRAIHQSGACDGRFDHIVRGVFSCLDQTPLALDVERMADPATEVNTDALVNLAAKYFFAFVHPGAQENPVPVEEIALLVMMYERCASLNEPDDDIEIMNVLRRHAPGLSLAADAGRAALILSELLRQAPAAGSKFLGLDIHTGSGLLALGQCLMARRLSRRPIEVWGMERDGATAQRAGELLRSLGAGNVVEADPASAASYDILGGRPVSMISTPLVTGETGSLSEDMYFGSYAALFEALGKEAHRSAFFPEGLIAYSRDMNASLILSRENGYQRPPEYADATFHPQGLVVDGRVLPLHRLASGIRNILR